MVQNVRNGHSDACGNFNKKIIKQNKIGNKNKRKLPRNASKFMCIYTQSGFFFFSSFTIHDFHIFNFCFQFLEFMSPKIFLIFHQLASKIAFNFAFMWSLVCFIYKNHKIWNNILLRSVNFQLADNSTLKRCAFNNW